MNKTASPLTDQQKYWKKRALDRAMSLAKTGHNPYIKDIEQFLDNAHLRTPQIQAALDKTGKAVDELIMEIFKSGQVAVDLKELEKASGD